MAGMLFSERQASHRASALNFKMPKQQGVHDEGYGQGFKAGWTDGCFSDS